MTDVFSKAKRSEIMSKIRGKHTKPELILKKHLRGFIYHPKGVFGSPDFISCKKKMVVFVDGCFWHGCPIHYRPPKSNKRYWLPKIERRKARDQEVNLSYLVAGWKVLRIWEHEI